MYFKMFVLIRRLKIKIIGFKIVYKIRGFIMFIFEMIAKNY